MENKLHLCVVTQDSTVFERNVSYVNIPAAFGSLGVLGGHAPMVCAVSRGQVRCAFDEDGAAVIEVGAGRRAQQRVGQPEAYGAGIAEVADNVVTVLVADAKVKE